MLDKLNDNIRLRRIIYYLMIVLMSLMLVGGITFLCLSFYDSESFVLKNGGVAYASIVNCSFDIICTIIGMVLFVSLYLEGSKKSKPTYILMAMIFVSVTSLFSDLLCWCFEGNSKYIVGAVISNTFFYAGGILVALLFWFYTKYIVQNDSKFSTISTYILLILCAFELILLLSNIGTGSIFRVASDGYYSRGSYGFYIFAILPVVSYVLVMISIFKNRMKTKQRIALSSFILLPFVVQLVQSMDFAYGISLTFTSMIISILIIFCNVHLEKTVELESKQAELTNQKLSIMLNQIQPHFIFNILSSIYYLCDKDSAKAKSAINDFSQYLRINIDSVNKSPLVSFRDELKFCEIYLNLEKIRFDDELQIIYDINTTDFMVPSFSIQPLVENAVKHGVSQKEGGGTVRICSNFVNGYYVVTVIDDGVGFDTSKSFSSDRNHVGINNVEYRINALVDGELTIKSEVGVGTTSEVKIPKKEN